MYIFAMEMNRFHVEFLEISSSEIHKYLLNPIAPKLAINELVEQEEDFFQYIFSLLKSIVSLSIFVYFKMDIVQKKNCRLCLNATTNEYKEKDEVMKLMFDVLLLKLDFDIIKDPIICKDCIEAAKKCLGFKFTCISTEQIILSYSSSRKDTGDLDICRFCLKTQFEKNNFSSLDTYLLTNTVIDMSAYFPEMDYYTAEGAIVCTTCQRYLENYHKFLVKCLDTEEKIQAYRKQKGTASIGQVKLVINPLLNICEDTCPPKGHNKETKSKRIARFKCSLCSFESKQKSIVEMHMRVHPDASRAKIHHCSLCPFETKRKGNLKAHLLVHKSVSELKLHKCSICAFETKYKSNLKAHLVLHKARPYSLCIYKSRQKNTLKRYRQAHADASETKMYQCSLCSYVTKRRGNLESHLLVHKSASELKLYKCQFCPYQAKHKSNLTGHMIIHKDISEIKMYKCSFCAYETKHKRNLTEHLKIHKDTREDKCPLCPYAAKCKGNLKKHMLVHKDVSELKMFKCSLCPYEAKLNACLTKHMVVHKNVSELKMNKCTFCPYETKRKGNLTKHLLTHKDISEVKMHECSLCPYKTKFKGNLKLHIRTHRDV